MRFVIYRDADKLCGVASCLLFVLLSEPVAAAMHYVGRSMPGTDQTPRLGQRFITQSPISPCSIYFHATYIFLPKAAAGCRSLRMCHNQTWHFPGLDELYIICLQSQGSDSLLRPLHIRKWLQEIHHLISKLLQLQVYSSALNHSSSSFLFIHSLMNEFFLALKWTETQPLCF